MPLPAAGSGLPLSRFVVAERLLRFDHVGGVSEVLRGDAQEIEAVLAAPAASPPKSSGRRAGPLIRFPDQAAHEAGVRRCQEHIRAGDAFQIVLSQPHAGRSREDGDAIAALLAKGALGTVQFRTDDLDTTFEKVASADGDAVLSEPADQFWGVRDAAVRDPAGNHLRIEQAKR